jgi:hypothetical protein
MNGRITILFLAVASAFPVLRAQQSSSDAAFIAPVPKAPRPKERASETPEPSGVTGVVAEALKLKKPLQMVNPLAPAKYGDGHDSVTWDPDNPEKPKGIIIFGIQW